MSAEYPIAVVTGGAKRVGRAICLELAAHGYEVWVHYGRSKTEASQLCEQIRAAGGEAKTFCADLSQRDGQDALVRALLSGLGQRKLGLLVHNASVFDEQKLESLSDEALDQALAIHAAGPLRLTRALAPHMRRDREGALVVMMLDAALLRPPPHHAHYSASKGALAALVPALCRDLAPSIRVVGISPGQVCWPEGYDDEKRETLRARIPQKRVGTPEEVAKLVRFLATEGTYINGVQIAIDGGASTVGIDRG